MYYYFTDNTAYVQNNDLKFRECNAEKMVSPGKILTELIYFDYKKLHEEYKSLDLKHPAFKQLPIKDVSKETKSILRQLLLTDCGFRKRENSGRVDEIIKMTEHIKRIILSNEYSNYDSKYIEFYFENIFDIRLNRMGMFFDNFAMSAIAPVLYKYENNYERFSKIVYNKIRNKNNDDSYISEYLESLNMQDLHYQIAEKIFKCNPFSAYPKNIIKSNSHTDLTEEELWEYINLCVEYYSDNICVVKNIPEFLVALLVDCVDNKIVFKQCECCGKIYYKTGRRKYCTDKCKKESKKQYESKRVCTYKTESGEEVILNYNSVLQTFEGKIKRVINKMKDEKIEEDEIITQLDALRKQYRPIIGNLIVDLQKAEKEGKETETETIQNAINTLIYEVSMFYKKRNSLYNEFEKGFESGEPICIKVPEVDGYEVKSKYLEFNVSQ